MQGKGIFALSSGAPPSGVAVFRLSGEGVIAATQSLLKSALPEPRRAGLRKIYSGTQVIDQALVIVFPAPHSFTGEDCVEIHTHGGRAVIRSLSACLSGLGLRPADPGEFTKRAFHNGRMDLTEAEALADLIHAETEAQRHQALKQMEGGLRTLYEGWRKALVKALALVEAEIDFSDEELPEGLFEQVQPSLLRLGNDINAHLKDNNRGERIREGIKIAILGPPNVGKSSLINALAKRDVAIVSDIAGTTRDVIEVHLDLGGYPVTIADTAGLREGGDGIEKEGMRRATQWGNSADLRILMYEGPHGPEPTTQEKPYMLLRNKIDRGGKGKGRDHEWAISIKTGEGVDEWLKALTAWVEENYGAHQTPTLSRQRHRHALEDCAAALERALDIGQVDTVLAAEDMRLAARALGRITGRVDVEDLLDVIFSEFCIGK